MVATFTEMILTLVSLVLAVLCYTVSQLQQHGKLRWSEMLHGFWGGNSSWRKYEPLSDEGFTLTPAPRTWYYKFFKLKYKERFPLSATLLSFTTDGYHLSQMFFKLFLALSFVPLTGWIWAGVIWLLWGIFFTIFYRLFSR